MNERDFWNFLRPKIQAVPGLLYDRIESHMVPGIPDITYSHNGHHGWIELKVFNDKRDHFTQVQRDWLKKRKLKAGNVWLFVMEKNAYSASGYSLGFISGGSVDMVPTNKREPIPDHAYAIFFPDYKNLTWENLRDIL